MILCLFLCLISSVTGSAATERSFQLFDYADNARYDITIRSDLVTIKSDSVNTSVYLDENVVSCCVYDGMFSFMSYTEVNDGRYMSVFYSFDSDMLSLESFAYNEECKYLSTGFAADINKRYYFIDSFDNSILHSCSKKSESYRIDCGNIIYQVMCIDGKNVTAITSEGIYLISGSTATKVSSTVPTVPCRYTGNDTIADSNNIEYTYKNGNIIPTETADNIASTTTTTQTDNNAVIPTGNLLYTSKGTTVAKLRNELQLDKGELSIFRQSGEAVTSGKLGTGLTAKFDGKQYNIIIRGDLTGEGNINSRDLKLLMKYLTGAETPSSIQISAADIDSNGIINTKDLLAVAKMY